MIELKNTLSTISTMLLTAFILSSISNCAIFASDEEDSSEEQRLQDRAHISISEIQIQNLDFKDDAGQLPSWIELYNSKDSTVSLKNVYLTDNIAEPDKWKFSSEEIPAKSYKIVFCDQKDSNFHTNWNLGKKGGSIYLLNSKFDVLDSVTYPQLTNGISYGKNNDGIWGYFSKATPENANVDSNWYSEIAKTKNLNTKSGFYKDPFILQAPTPSDKETIRCTQDGSVPSKNSPIFSKSLLIEKNTILRCAGFKNGALTINTTTRSYFVGEKIKMPVISVSVDPIFFKESYYYDNHSCSDPNADAGYLNETEYPVHVEYFAKGSSSKKVSFEIDAGISIAGGCTRYYPKKSVNIKMRKVYQDGKLTYTLFDTRPNNNKFKSFRLRNLGNRFYKDYVGDAAFTSLLEGTTIDYQRSHPVVVFYNGEYYGIHNIREILNDDYIETNYGINSKTVTVVEHHRENFSGKSIKKYVDFIRYIANSDFSRQDEYDTLQTKLDIINFTNYMAFEIYSLNDDWPTNNVRAWKSDSTRWKYMAFDIDHGFNLDSYEWQKGNQNIFDWIRDRSTPWSFAKVYTQLIQNDDFKRAFINHSAILFSHYLTAEKVSNAVKTILAQIDSDEMDRDMERFPRSVSKDGEDIIKWAVERDKSVIEDYRKEFNLGKTTPVSFEAKGAGYITIDGMRLPENHSKTFSGTFFRGNKLLIEAIPESGHNFTQWDDGVTENPRLVSPEKKSSYTANFK